MKVAAIQMVSGIALRGQPAPAPATCWRRPRKPAPSWRCCPNTSASWASKRHRQARGCARASATARCSASWRRPRASSACGSSAARCRWQRATRATCATARWSFRPAGECVARYDKIHLFYFDNGRERYDESRVIERRRRAGGVRPALARRPPLARRHERLLRPALSRAVPRRSPGRRCCWCPAPSPAPPAQAHWEVLLRARAIENLAWVVAPAQGGTHENGRRTWGHSMVVDPWGAVVAQQARGRRRGAGRPRRRAPSAVRTQLPAL